MPRWIALLATCLALIACGPARAAAPPRPAVAFVGDSLTGGWFATTDAQSFPRLVTASWHARMVARVGTYGLKAPTLLPDVARLPRDTARVVLEVGTNDFGQTDLDTFRKSYSDLVTAVERHAPKAWLLCLGIWRGADESRPQGTRQQYDDAIEAICGRDRFIDLSSTFMHWANHGPEGRSTWRGIADWFHPNDQGHAAIAAAIEGAARG